jgi:hypothetical protein
MDGAMERIPHRLDPAECRELGALLEKEQATPEYYPLTLNALVAACNQKSNREPVMELTDDAVRDALERLLRHVLVWKTEGSRVLRWRHAVDRRWSLDAATKAVMTLLLLRGPQTVGELRGRSDRLHRFAGTGEVEAALAALAAGREPLVRELAREPGQKEPRWAHRVGADDPATAAAGRAQRSAPAAAGPAATAAPAAASGLAARLEALEVRVAALEARLSGRD